MKKENTQPGVGDITALKLFGEIPGQIQEIWHITVGALWQGAPDTAYAYVIIITNGEARVSVKGHNDVVLHQGEATLIAKDNAFTISNNMDYPSEAVVLRLK